MNCPKKLEEPSDNIEDWNVIFFRSQSPSDKAALRTAARPTKREQIDGSPTTWLKSKVTDAVTDPKRLWRTAKQLLHTTKSDNTNDGDCALVCNKLGSSSATR